MKNVFIGFRKFLALGAALTLAIALFLALGVSASAADWQKNFTKEVVNIRAEDGGTVLVHHLIIAEGNLYADGAASVPGGDN